MGRTPLPRGPKWEALGQQIKDARRRLDMTQKAVANQLGGGTTHQLVSRDETGVFIEENRLRAYCNLFHWDYNKITEFIAAPDAEPIILRAQREYIELFTLLDGHLKDGEEQDLVDEALQVVIMHRYPELSPKDFVPQD